MTDSITSVDAYYDLGDFHRSITTKSIDAQRWFDRGLIWCYGFHHEEAVRCFEKVIAFDSDCAMGFWGLAYALGPNYNKPWQLFDQQDLVDSVKRTYHVSRQAKQLAESNATPLEKALIDALTFRYPQDHPAEDFMPFNIQYADAMRKVYLQFGEDLDVATLYADALLILAPWKLWEWKRGEPTPGARTLELKDVLEKALARKGSETHPGLLHMYIHLIEMSNSPELGLRAADRLRGLVPQSGHLNHMPAHIDILCGDYRRAIASSIQAVRADTEYVARGGGNDFYTIYRMHNYHTMIYAAMLSGQFKVAMDAVSQIEKALTESVLRIESPPMADWMESLLAIRLHVLIRFGKWHDIVEYHPPADQQLYCVTTASAHYAKAIAWAALGEVSKAEIESELFNKAVERIPLTRLDVPSSSRDVLQIARAMMDGELEYRRGNYKISFEHFEKSVTLYDSLVYSEPPSWLQPTRHAYAALLLERDHVEEAMALYRADLGFDKNVPRVRHHPFNIWALHGYHECLVRLGRNSEADIISQQLTLAKAVADVTVSSSCYCRLNTAESKGNCNESNNSSCANKCG